MEIASSNYSGFDEATIAFRKLGYSMARLLMDTTPVLHLNLKGEWFDMISILVKEEEYREIKPFWSRIFTDDGIKIKGKYYRPKDIIICFSNGMAKDRRQMLFKLNRIVIRAGNPEWGAEEGTSYYCLVLGEKIWQGTANELQDAYEDIPF